MVSGSRRVSISSLHLLLLLLPVIVFLVCLLTVGSAGTQIPAASAAAPPAAEDEEEPLFRVRKHASDQRVAELQALIALMKNSPIEYGHGLVDPHSLGRRKRIGLRTEMAPGEYSRKMTGPGKSYRDGNK